MRLRNTQMLSLCFLMLAGCNLLASKPDGKPDAKPDPVVVEYTDQDHYSYLAECVESDVFASSDDLCRAVDILARTAKVKDVSRMSSVRAKRIEPIAGDDKSKLIALLKGN